MAQSNGDETDERTRLILEMSDLTLGELVDFFLADRKQHELDARIDSLADIRVQAVKHGNTYFDKYTKGCIAELKAEREGL